MKMVIVGGGLSGLVTYLHLRKHLPSKFHADITIYERHEGPKTPTNDLTSQVSLSAVEGAFNSRLIVGGGLGVGPNGMRVLRRLSESLHHRVRAAGFPASQFNFRTSSNAELGSVSSMSVKPTTEETVMAQRAWSESLR